MGAVDKGLDLTPGEGTGGQMWGTQPCLSPSHFCCMHFLSCPSPFLLHACPLFPIFLQEHSLSFPPSPIYFACLLP